MVESTAVSCIHPDKHNNSVDRIISKEEEREDPRRDSSIYLRVQNTVVFPQIIQELQDFFEYSVFYSVSTRNPATTSNSSYIINSSTRILQEILQLQGSSHADQYKASSSDCSRVSKHSTRQNKAPGFPTAFQGHTAQAGFQLILPGRNSIPSGSQHPRSPYSNSQAESNPPSTKRIHLVLQNSTR